jgi:hypothetical protein
MSVCCIFEPNKIKSRRVMEALAEGLGARLRSYEQGLDDAQTVAFYGVRPAWKHLWEQCKAEGRTWLYIDNSLFDSCRERHFRIARNRLQPTGEGESDGKRFAELGIPIKPMRDGDKVIVAAQSDEFMECVAEDPGWTERVTAAMRREYGMNRVILRRKGIGRPLADDLRHAGLLVTYSSAAAVTALLEGVRVVCSPECCATYAGDDRRRWASVLANEQFTLEEMRTGMMNSLIDA